jgi:hypothetical protein
VLDARRCDVNSSAELDAEIRDIFSLDLQQRGDEIRGTLYVDYVGEATKQASLIPSLEGRGVQIVWRKKPQVRKAYIQSIFRANPTDHHDTFELCETPEQAHYWTARLAAELRRDYWSRGVTVPSAWGGSYTCYELSVEEISPDHFVLSLEAPFAMKEPVRGSAASFRPDGG